MTNAEEVAFNDDSLPSGKSEEMVLNWHLSRLVKHGRLSAFQRFVQQVFDGFAVKYMASAVALLLYAAPLYFRDPSLRGTQDDLTQVIISIPALAHLEAGAKQVCCAEMPLSFVHCVHLSLALSLLQDYIRAMRLLQNTSRCVSFQGLIRGVRKHHVMCGRTDIRVRTLLTSQTAAALGNPDGARGGLMLQSLLSGALGTLCWSTGGSQAWLAIPQGSLSSLSRSALCIYRLAFKHKVHVNLRLPHTDHHCCLKPVQDSWPSPSKALTI